MSCYAEKNCNIDPYMCDGNARCVTNASRSFVCECNPGYTGNGTLCKEIPKHGGDFLLLNQGIVTHQIPFESDGRKRKAKIFQVQARQTAIGLEADCYDGRVYWSDINGKAIRSASYNGSDKRNLVTAGEYINFGTLKGLRSGT